MSNQENRSFRDQLLSQEKSDTQLQKIFQQEVKKMYTEKLKKGHRIGYILTSLLIAFMTFLFWVFAKMFEEIQIKHEVSYIEPLRLASMWAMYLGAVLTALSLWPAIWGKVGLRFYPKAVRFISWVLIFAVVLLIFGLVDFMRHETDFQVADSTIDILGAAIISILIIIMSIYMLLSGRIDRGYLKHKAKTLELECRLAELEEKFKSGE
ncbi:MAG: hypothetical protein ACYSTR_10050 [Planctomycetota bacterium]|jgi:heme/copper-type cytochrome/quinol oxidase subunit 4